MTTKTEYVQGASGTLSTPAQLGLFRLPQRREFLLEHAGPPPQHIVDVGCASGFVATLLLQAGHRVTGIELNAQMAAEARQVGIDVIEHDLEEPLPFPDESVDVVHACEILEHLFDTEGFLKEVHRVLRVRGRLVLSTPNLNSLQNRLRVLFGRSLPMWGAYPADRHGSHVRVFNKAKILELLARCGFEPLGIRGVNQFRFSHVIDPFPSLSELILVAAERVDAG